MSLSVVTAAAETGRPVVHGKCRGSARLDMGYFAGQVTRLSAPPRLALCIESQDWPSGPASDHLRTDESLREALLFSLFWRQAPSPAHVSEYKLPAKNHSRYVLITSTSAV